MNHTKWVMILLIFSNVAKFFRIFQLRHLTCRPMIWVSFESSRPELVEKAIFFYFIQSTIFIEHVYWSEIVFIAVLDTIGEKSAFGLYGHLIFYVSRVCVSRLGLYLQVSGRKLSTIVGCKDILSVSFQLWGFQFFSLVVDFENLKTHLRN